LVKRTDEQVRNLSRPTILDPRSDALLHDPTVSG
jgi:hypothetical protein